MRNIEKSNHIVTICGLSDEVCYVVKSRCLLSDARHVVYTARRKYWHAGRIKPGVRQGGSSGVHLFAGQPLVNIVFVM